MPAKSTIAARSPAAATVGIHDDPAPASVSVSGSCDALDSSSASRDLVREPPKAATGGFRDHRGSPCRAA
jgi:hypothetical protein